MENTMILFNSSFTNISSHFTDHNSTRITPISPVDTNRQAFFLIGMSFLGGLLAGIILNCFYSILFRYFLDQLDWEDTLPEGHVNLSFIGDECPFDDPPPDYSTVMGVESRPQGSFFGFFDRFSRRNREVDEEDEAPPPSYSSYIVSLEMDLNER